MFTGIIEGLGTITNIRPTGEGRRITVNANFALEGTKIGDSIAVNGACLTAVLISKTQFEVDVSPETLDKTTLKNAKIGDRTNIERALRLSDRLDGHLVSGHIDGTGQITHKTRHTNAFEVSIIPHTADITTIGIKNVGETVNIETDMIGKYVEKFLANPQKQDKKESKGEAVDMEFLSKTGFI